VSRTLSDGAPVRTTAGALIPIAGARIVRVSGREIRAPSSTFDASSNQMQCNCRMSMASIRLAFGPPKLRA
jgi:hypothetical protein